MRFLCSQRRVGKSEGRLTQRIKLRVEAFEGAAIATSNSTLKFSANTALPHWTAAPTCRI